MARTKQTARKSTGGMAPRKKETYAEHVHAQRLERASKPGAALEREQIKASLENFLEASIAHKEFRESSSGNARELPALPGLVVEGFGLAAELAALSSKSKYGKGTETSLDDAIRDSNEFDPSRSVVRKVTSDLGLGVANVKANLYKLLLYGPGQHFKQFHKDSEKEKGMFGTLVIQLPSAHEGGAITFRFRGRESTYDFGVGSGLAQFEPHFVAHYADVDHKISPVTKGFRLALVYNLVWADSGEVPTADLTSNRVASGLKIIDRWINADEDLEDQFLIWLDHDYTEDSFNGLGINALKGSDRSYGRLLLDIAKGLEATKPNTRLRVCAVLREKSETYIGSGDNYDDVEWDKNPEDVEEEPATWVPLDGFPLLQDDREFELEDQLLFGEESGDWESGESEVSGYLGNEGATKKKQYFAAMLAIWLEDTSPDAIFESLDLLKYTEYVHGLFGRASDEVMEKSLERVFEKLQEQESLNWSEFKALSNLSLAIKNRALIAAIFGLHFDFLESPNLGGNSDPIAKMFVSLMMRFSEDQDLILVPLKASTLRSSQAVSLILFARYLHVNLPGHSFEREIIQILVSNLPEISKAHPPPAQYSGYGYYGQTRPAADKVSNVIISIFEFLFDLGDDDLFTLALKVSGPFLSGLINTLLVDLKGIEPHPYFRRLVVALVSSLDESLIRLQEGLSWATLPPPDNISDTRALAFIRSPASSIVLGDVGGATGAKTIGTRLQRWNSGISFEVVGSGKPATLRLRKSDVPTPSYQVQNQKSELERRLGEIRKLLELKPDPNVKVGKLMLGDPTLAIDLAAYEKPLPGADKTIDLVQESSEDEVEKRDNKEEEQWDLPIRVPSEAEAESKPVNVDMDIDDEDEEEDEDLKGEDEDDVSNSDENENGNDGDEDDEGEEERPLKRRRLDD